MATPRKTAAGSWRIEIEVKGQRESSTWPTKREALEWRDRRSMELRAMAGGRAGEVKTLADAMDRYIEEVLPHHRGHAKEYLRLQAFRGHESFPAGKRLAELTAADLSAWRDARLKVVARGSVLRDMGLLQSVLESARRDWRWIEANPLKEVRKPANPDHRERVISGPEIRGMLRAMGYDRRAVRSVAQACAHAFLLALATGMRAGEICGLRWGQVSSRWVDLPITKNGSARQVPLSTVAVKIIGRMRGWDDELVFGMSSQTLDAMFRKYRERAGLSGFTFHDSRHTAATRLGRQGRIHVLDMCKMFGWKNPKMAMVYFNPTAADLAAKLG